MCGVNWQVFGLIGTEELLRPVSFLLKGQPECLAIVQKCSDVLYSAAFNIWFKNPITNCFTLSRKQSRHNIRFLAAVHQDILKLCISEKNMDALDAALTQKETMNRDFPPWPHPTVTVGTHRVVMLWPIAVNCQILDSLIGISETVRKAFD